VASYRLGNEWVVDSGLKPGDRVVVEGIGKVRAGSPVKAVPAAPQGSASASSDATAKK
jgi:membrane fusion protein (multidrug efflux system)